MALGGALAAKADFRAIWGALGDSFWGSKITKNDVENNMKFDVSSELYFGPSGGRSEPFWA